MLNLTKVTFVCHNCKSVATFNNIINNFAYGRTFTTILDRLAMRC